MEDIIWLQIANGENDVLRWTADNKELRVQKHLAEGGGHFKQYT